MKTLQAFILSFLFLSFTYTAAGQEKNETFKVAGECGMCKKKIETAAKAAGATYAVWNVTTKELAVKYNSTATSTAKLQQAIAATGYDTPTAKATDAAYKALHECCQYDRATAAVNTTEAAACCADAACCKDGKCTADATCCKDKSCCTDGACTHAKEGNGTTSCCKKA